MIVFILCATKLHSMNNLKIMKKMVSFKETISNLSGEFPILRDCFLFIGKTSRLSGLLPVCWENFLFIGMVSHSSGKLPVNRDCFSFTEIVFPSINIAFKGYGAQQTCCFRKQVSCLAWYSLYFTYQF